MVVGTSRGVLHDLGYEAFAELSCLSDANEDVIAE
jgi:hypothetical protein